MSQREDRLKADARARYQRQQERINRGQVKVPSNDEALRELAEGMAASGQDKAAVQAALEADQDAGKARLRTAPRDEEHEREDPWVTSEAFVDRVLADPELEKSLTSLQRLAVGHRLDERKLQAEIAAEEAANAGS
jgi:hypothetical protein